MNTKLQLVFLSLFFISLAAFGQAKFYPAEKIPLLLQKAKRYYGSTYCYGGTGPRCFDCSGFVKRAFNDAGIQDIPRRSSDQYYGYEKGITFHGKAKLHSLQEGDLVYFDTPGTLTHIGIVVANNKGKVQFIHAARKGVRYDFITGYWYQHYIGARRVFETFEEDLDDEVVIDEKSGNTEEPAENEDLDDEEDEFEVVIIEDEKPKKGRLIPKTAIKGEYPIGSLRRLTHSDLAEYTPCEIKIMKNEIFARHGYKFYLNPCMIQLFMSTDYSWYNDVPRKNNPQYYFSPVEKANVDLLLKYEGKCNCE